MHFLSKFIKAEKGWRGRERKKQLVHHYHKRCVPWILNHGISESPVLSRIVRVSSSQLLRSRSKKSHETSSYSAHSASSWIFFSAFWSNPLYPYCLIAVTRFTPTHSWPVEIFCPGPRLESCPNSHEKLPSLGTGQTTTIAAIINNSNLNQITQSNSQTISLRKHLQFAFDA